MDRRKIHPNESKKITFWKDNDVNKEYQISMGTIISGFLLSDEYKRIIEGMPFSRVILNFMAGRYGSYDVFANNELDDLYEIYRFRLEGK